MYADRYAKSGGFKPASFTLALAINGAILTGLALFANPVIRAHINKDFRIVDIPIDKPPPVDLVPPKPQPKVDHPLPKEAVDTVKPIVTTPIDTVHVGPLPPIDLGIPDGTGTDIGTIIQTPAKPQPPVLVQPTIKDIANFQPVYPADEARAGNGGRVVVRVLVGVDGRVKDIQRVSATSDSFFEATRRRALDKWRFKPGTRDGVPVEAWREIGVSFVLEDASR